MASVYSEMSKEHLKRIGQRFYMVRKELEISSLDIEDKLNLPGSVVTRLENGKGIQIFNLLKIIHWLDSIDYNINWFMLYDNQDIFPKKQDALALFSDAVPSNSFRRKELLSKTEKIFKEVEDLKGLISKY